MYRKLKNMSKGEEHSLFYVQIQYEIREENLCSCLIKAGKQDLCSLPASLLERKM
jgi:hypothetical protein